MTLCIYQGQISGTWGLVLTFVLTTRVGQPVSTAFESTAQHARPHCFALETEGQHPKSLTSDSFALITSLGLCTSGLCSERVPMNSRPGAFCQLFCLAYEIQLLSPAAEVLSWAPGVWNLVHPRAPSAGLHVDPRSFPPTSKYYEKEALLMDPVDGPILASLLGK